MLFRSPALFTFQISTPTLYLYTGELFPTVLRNTGVGGCVMFSKIGSVVAPLIVSTQEVVWFMPVLVLGSLALFEAVLIFPLPESGRVELVDTLEQMELR